MLNKNPCRTTQLDSIAKLPLAAHAAVIHNSQRLTSTCKYQKSNTTQNCASCKKLRQMENILDNYLKNSNTLVA